MHRTIRLIASLLILACATPFSWFAHAAGRSPEAQTNGTRHSRLVHPGPDGRLIYQSDEKGNRLPDFSHAGYSGGQQRAVELRCGIRRGGGTTTARAEFRYRNPFAPHDRRLGTGSHGRPGKLLSGQGPLGVVEPRPRHAAPAVSRAAKGRLGSKALDALGPPLKP